MQVERMSDAKIIWHTTIHLTMLAFRSVPINTYVCLQEIKRKQTKQKQMMYNRSFQMQSQLQKERF